MKVGEIVQLNTLWEPGDKGADPTTARYRVVEIGEDGACVLALMLDLPSVVLVYTQPNQA